MVIKKEDIEKLPIEVFPGSIHIIDKQEQVPFACEKLQAESIIGFDTETKPSFKKGISHKVSLLQLSTDNECFLFRLNKLDGIPKDLLDVLTNTDIKIIGLSIKDDFKAIRKLINFKSSQFIEIQALVKSYGIEDQSLQKIYAILFNKKIAKGQRLSNWEKEELTPAQQMYAAIDAWACVRIYKELLSREKVK